MSVQVSDAVVVALISVFGVIVAALISALATVVAALSSPGSVTRISLRDQASDEK